MHSHAMEGAAKNGHFDVLLFLHANYREGCARDAIIDGNECFSNLEIVQWLYEKYPDAVNVERLMSRSSSSVRGVLAHVFGFAPAA